MSSRLPSWIQRAAKATGRALRGHPVRARHLLPRQGERAPWRLRQHYFKDAALFRGPIDEKNLQFRPAPALVRTAP
jgi:cyclohexanone monooxygenase